MRIHIKDQYQPIRELTVAQANLELQQGIISTAAIVWKPGLQDWIPILSLSDIHAPIPPPIPLNRLSKSQVIPKLESEYQIKNQSFILEYKWNIWSVLATIGITLAYVILISNTYSAAIHPEYDESIALWAAICSILLFRRKLRIRSQIIISKNSKLNLFLHYLHSYWSAFWRWLLIFIGIIALEIISVETADSAGIAFARSIAIMIFGIIFAIDIPFKVFRAYLKFQESSFEQHYIGWILFLLIIIFIVLYLLI